VPTWKTSYCRYLVHEGFVGSIDEAFDKYLGKGKAAYVEKFRISCREAIKLILDAGGLPVLAHPYLLQLEKGVVFEELIGGAKIHGIKRYRNLLSRTSAGICPILCSNCQGI
jgi:predicted metal-dependent phosphoesterase TrpH